MAASAARLVGAPSWSAQGRVGSQRPRGAARPSPCLVSSAARFAALAGLGRPCGFGPQGLVVGLCALHAGAPMSARLRRQNGGRGLAWLVVRGLSRRAHAAGSCVAQGQAARSPLLVRAWLFGRVVRGGPRRFIPEALAPGKVRASGRFVSSRPLSRALLFCARETASWLCHARLLW